MTGVLGRAPAAALAAALVIAMEIVLRAGGVFHYGRYADLKDRLGLDSFYWQVWRRDELLADAAGKPGGVLIEGPSSLEYAVDEGEFLRVFGYGRDRPTLMPVNLMSPIDLYSDLDATLRARPRLVVLFLHMHPMDDAYERSVERRPFFFRARVIPALWKVLGSRRAWGQRATVIDGAAGRLFPAFRRRSILRAIVTRGTGRPRLPKAAARAEGLLDAPAAPAAPSSPLTVVSEDSFATGATKRLRRVAHLAADAQGWALPRLEARAAPDQVAFLRLLLAALRNRGIRVLLVDSPIPDVESYRRVYASPEYRVLLGSLAREFDCEVLWDHGDYPKDLFSDERHLNDAGRLKYTDMFAVFLKERSDARP